MKLEGGIHLGYCTNIHPGESFDQLLAALRRHVPPLKQRLCPDAPFGLGLRISDECSRELEDEQHFEQLVSFLESAGAYVFTVNAFPFGKFHGARVKERVYLPDWSAEERVAYTLRVGRFLARVSQAEAAFCGASLPEVRSISTVPGGFRSTTGALAREAMARHLARVAFEFAQIEAAGGPRIGLAIEPEPACVVETTDEAIHFLEREVFGRCGRPGGAREALRDARRSAPTSGESEELLRRHLGICLDACHSAVQFEDPAETVRRLRSSGVPVFKLQATAGLALEPTKAAVDRLRDFDDGVYLHQGSVASVAGIRRFLDLPEVLTEQQDPDPEPSASGSREEWRVHFHVPVFQRELGLFSSTQRELSVFLEEQRRSPLTTHVEVETYTFDVLPERYRSTSVSEAIARELEWTRARLEGAD